MALFTLLGAPTAAVGGEYPGVADPGGDPTIPVSVPPPAGKFFGYHEGTAETDVHGWSAAEMAEVAAGAGANTHRFTINWWNVEPYQDHWDENWWARIDRLYDALISEGIRPLVTIAGTPMWAVHPTNSGCGHRLGCEYPPASWMNPQWAEFAGEVARRLPEAAAIEIWNEPNNSDFYKGSPDPWRYADLVRWAYNGIKAANPDMTVLAGALAPTQTPENDILGNLRHMPVRRFLEIAYTAEGGSLKDHMDGISFHTTFQQTDLGAESLYAKVFHDVRSVSSSFGDAGIDLWISETGLSTHGDERVQAFTERQQADGLLAQYRKVMQMPDAKGIVFHTLAEQKQLGMADWNRGFGSIWGWNPLWPKLAYCAFAGRVDTPTPYGGCPRIVDPPPTGSGGDTGGGDTGGGDTGGGDTGGGGTGGGDTGGGGTGGGDTGGGDTGGGDTGGGGTGGGDTGGGDTGSTPPPADPSAVSGECATKLARLTRLIVDSSGAEQQAAKRKYRRVERRCVPCARKQARAKRKLRREGSGPAAASLRARHRRIKARCAPCVRKLRALQGAALTAPEAERAAYLRRYEAARKRCTARRR